MKLSKLIAFSLIISLISIEPPIASAQLKDFLKSIGEALRGRELSENTIIRGLKEALQIGTGNAVQIVSKVDGYYKSPKIRIPLPDSVQKVEKLLRAVGYGSRIDAFELSMNRAAERAAPEANSMFINAITQMTFTDAKKILQGRDNEATLYFEDKTRGRLHELFRPIVHSVLSEVGVTRWYQELETKVRSIPFTESLNVDLDGYVTDKALDGLFFMVAEEERKIRQDPAARITDLLKEVFGGKAD
jgi:hypothetical protein